MAVHRAMRSVVSQSIQELEGMAEGIYASPSSSTRLGRDPGLTHLPRLQAGDPSVGFEACEQSLRNSTVKGLAQNASNCGAKISIDQFKKKRVDLASEEGEKSKGSRGIYSTGDNNVVGGGHDLDIFGDFEIDLDNAIPGSATPRSLREHVSFSDGFLRDKKRHEAQSFWIPPSPTPENVQQRTATVKLGKKEKTSTVSLPSSGPRPTFRRSNYRDTRPSFSSFSRRPNAGRSIPTNTDEDSPEGRSSSRQTSVHPLDLTTYHSGAANDACEGSDHHRTLREGGVEADTFLPLEVNKSHDFSFGLDFDFDFNFDDPILSYLVSQIPEPAFPGDQKILTYDKFPLDQPYNETQPGQSSCQPRAQCQTSQPYGQSQALQDAQSCASTTGTPQASPFLDVHQSFPGPDSTNRTPPIHTQSTPREALSRNRAPAHEEIQKIRTSLIRQRKELEPEPVLELERGRKRKREQQRERSFFDSDISELIKDFSEPQ